MRTNRFGNKEHRDFYVNRTRCYYDRYECSAAKGWEQYDTDQDASYFGVWIHREYRQIMTFAEGDEVLTLCENAETFRAELANMADFYGAPPPFMLVIDEDGQATEYVQLR